LGLFTAAKTVVAGHFFNSAFKIYTYPLQIFIGKFTLRMGNHAIDHTAGNIITKIRNIITFV
jgi:hypothetical protein